MSTPKVSVVIPTRGTHGLIRGRSERLVDQAIEGIINSSAGLDPEIVLVVDDDVPLDYVGPWHARLGSRLVVVRTSPPFNFSFKINQGALAAQGEYLVLFNDDACPITPDWLTRMLKFARQPDVGAVGAQLLYEDGTLQHVGHAYAYGNVFHFDAGHTQPTDSRSRNAVDRDISGVTAACLMQRRSVWEELGGLDESFPINFNDVDYCVRIRRKGYRIVQCNTAQLFHYESKTRDTVVRHWETREIQRRLGDLLRGEDEYTPGVRAHPEARPRFWSRVSARFQRRTTRLPI